MSNSTAAPSPSANILDLESVQLDVCLDYAMLAVVLYDYALTFSAERQYIWKPKKSIVFYLFIALRYSFIAEVLADAFSDFLPLHTSKGCSIIVHIYDFLDMSIPLYIGGVFTLRTYAIWRNNTYVLTVLAILVIGQLGAGIYLNISLSLSVATDELRLFTTCIASPGSHTFELNVADSAIVVAFDTIVLILTAARTFQQTLTYRKLKLHQGLSYFVLRDGMVYYLAIEGFTVVTIAVTYLPLPIWTFSIVNHMADIVLVLLTQRLVLNLRQVNDELHSPTYMPSLDLGELNFAHGATLGNIGAPLRTSGEDELEFEAEEERNVDQEGEGVHAEEEGSHAIELDEFAIEEVPREA